MPGIPSESIMRGRSLLIALKLQLILKGASLGGEMDKREGDVTQSTTGALRH